MEDNQFIDFTIALQYDSYGEKFLTDFDRMFIHKKRSALLNDKEYQLPEELEIKIIKKLHYIEKTNWTNPYENGSYY